MRFAFLLFSALAAISLSACSAVPPLEPIEQRPKAPKVVQQGVVVMTLREAIDRYAPPDFKLARPDVDLNTGVEIDTSMPWQKAFAMALANAGLDKPAALPQPTAATPAPLPVFATPRADAAGPAPHAAAALSGPAGSTAMAQDTTAAPAATIPAAPSVHQKPWEAKPNASLMATLEQWCKDAGWDLSWNYKDLQTGEKRDLTLGGGLSYQGTFNDAVKELFNSFPSHIKIQADLWSGNNPPLLHVYNDGTDK